MADLDARQYLTFTLGSEEYALDILAVQEIKGGAAITPVPGTAPWVRGVMNLRGVIVPVLDLRTKLAIGGDAPAAEPVIVVVMVKRRPVGLAVDSVCDVVGLAPAAVQSTPELIGHVDTRLVSGLAVDGERMIVLLDVERLVGDDAAAPVVS